MIGALPAGLPTPYWPGLPGWDALGALVVPALVIALVSSLEMAASAKIESQREGKRWDAGQDLIGQGVGKLASAFSGSFPTSASFSRSAITLFAGARPAGPRCSPPLWFCWCCCSSRPLLYHVPRAVLAAVVVTAVVGPVQAAHASLRLWQIDRVEALTGRGHLRGHAGHRAADLLGRAGRRA